MIRPILDEYYPNFTAELQPVEMLFDTLCWAFDEREHLREICNLAALHVPLSDLTWPSDFQSLRLPISFELIGNPGLRIGEDEGNVFQESNDDKDHNEEDTGDESDAVEALAEAVRNVEYDRIAHDRAARLRQIACRFYSADTIRESVILALVDLYAELGSAEAVLMAMDAANKRHWALRSGRRVPFLCPSEFYSRRDLDDFFERTDVVDRLLKGLGYAKDTDRLVSGAEVMTWVEVESERQKHSDPDAGGEESLRT